MALRQQRAWPSVGLVVKCCCIATNALSAGGIFCFPLFAPTLAEHLHLSQPELSTIVLAGMMGQYPFSVVFGTIVDKYGPWACSLASSVLFSIGFGLFSYEISQREWLEPGEPSPFRRLVLYYFIAGLGTVSGYFSALFAASKAFPHRSGIAAGVSTSLFGLSPLFLSFIASQFFSSPDTGLHVARFTAFLSVFAGSLQLLGSFGLRIDTPSIHTPEATHGDAEAADAQSPEVERSEHTEEEPLLRKVYFPVANCPQDESLSALIRDGHFWVLALAVMFTLGACEMVIANIGTIVLSLPPEQTLFYTVAPVTTAVATQVRILSLSNTLSRLLTGPLADLLSPMPLRAQCGGIYYPRQYCFSRIVFIVLACLLLVGTFSWTASRMVSQGSVWILSIGAGVAYGTIFTVLPSITASLWGGQHFGRNFSLISYAPFIGTPIFSIIYAHMADIHTPKDQPVCLGTVCWRSTFWMCASGALVATLLSCGLWKRAKGRV